MKELRINPIVVGDLTDIREYISQDSEEMAVKTIQEILNEDYIEIYRVVNRFQDFMQIF